MYLFIKPGEGYFPKGEAPPRFRLQPASFFLNFAGHSSFALYHSLVMRNSP
jgi:hypothetical protein